MKKYIIHRFLQLIPVLIGITFLSFAMMRIAGSDAIIELYGDKGAVAEEIIAAKQAELGLDKPFLTQYLAWVGGMMRGDMGVSYVSGKAVFPTFLSKLPATLLLTALSIGLTVVISIPLGGLAAVRHDRFTDYFLRFFSFVGNSLPNFFVALLLIVCSVFSEHLTPYDPYLQDLSIAKQGPSSEHLLGTDRYGRDMLSRVIVGSRASIFSSLLLVAIITVLGTAIGVVCGWSGKRLDTVLMRISDLFLAFPGLVFALAVAGCLGGGLQNAIIALAAISWPKYARIARSQTLAQKETAWMKAAKLSGSSTVKIIFVHILPNIIGPILVTSMLDIGTMMMELAALSFLGLGAKPPIAEWGSMMSDTRSLMTTSPWITFSPGIAIFLSVMIFNLLGDTLRDYADPKSRGR